MILFFEPFYRIGDFELNTRIENYIFKYDFSFSPADDITDWETYSLDHEGISLYVENSKIISISCSDECLFNGRNLIGMNIIEFKSFYGLESTGSVDHLFVNESEIQEVYEFDKIGLQIWCKSDVIVTVISSSDED